MPKYTSTALGRLAKVGGPRCCKRDAFLAFEEAIKFINENYPIKLETQKIVCGFSEKNEQCINERCPFHAESGR